jgi:hypothetical protein
VAITFFILIYFFLYPDGQVGFSAVTFLDVLPFTQVIVSCFATGLVTTGAADGAGAGTTAGASCESFT